MKTQVQNEKTMDHVFADGSLAPPAQDGKFRTDEKLPDYDMQNEFAGMSVICESPEAYYFQPTTSHFIWYCDKETGASGKLCGRPECTHEGKDCNAYSIAISGLNYYDQALYWGSSDDMEANGKHYLWRMKPKWSPVA